jgi:hypothetical protein
MAAPGQSLNGAASAPLFVPSRIISSHTIGLAYLNNRPHLSAKSVRLTKILSTRMIVRTLMISTIQTLFWAVLHIVIKTRSGMEIKFLREFLQG